MLLSFQKKDLHSFQSRIYQNPRIGKRKIKLKKKKQKIQSDFKKNPKTLSPLQKKETPTHIVIF